MPYTAGVESAVSEEARRRTVERLYREQRSRLWRALVGFTGDPDLANDALAEAFAQLLSRGTGIRNPEPWVWKASFRIAAGELKRWRQHLPSSRERFYEMPEPADHLLAALARISPNQRLAVVLHDYADRPTEEVAAVLGVTRATVHVHLSNGRRRLRELLEVPND